MSLLLLSLARVYVQYSLFVPVSPLHVICVKIWSEEMQRPESRFLEEVSRAQSASRASFLETLLKKHG